uniref:ATP-dependent DNA helicase n=1 Tax=Tanacetum cinerariifolium TaxID=118510 RepID=A0A699GWC1_TANCI|nr:DNA helicase [Tanacetum cinerariifolium]
MRFFQSTGNSLEDLRDHVEITGTSFDVEQKVKTPVEKGFCLFIDVHVGSYKVPAKSIRDIGSYKNVRHRLLPTFSSMSANASKLPTSIEPHTEPAHTNENRVGKWLLSNTFSPCVHVDRSEPLSPVDKSISIKQNARMCVAPSEEHDSKVLWRFRNACSNKFRSFEFGISKTGDNHGVQYPTLIDDMSSYMDLGDCDQRYTPATRNICPANTNRNSPSTNTQNPSSNTADARDDTPSYMDLGDCDQQCRHYGCLFWLDEITLNPEIAKGLIHVLDEHNGLVRLFRTAHDRCNTGDIPSFKIRLYNMGGVHGYELPTADVLKAIVFKNGPRSQAKEKSDNERLLQISVTPTEKRMWPYFQKQFSELTPTDRTDIVCRVFEQNVKDFLRFLKEVKTLGYVFAGPDHILEKISNSETSTFAVGITKKIDEIQNYVDGRFICPYEACWRIFDFPIHYRERAVQILNVHLKEMQRINFHERDRLDIIVNIPEKKKTTLTEWFVYNSENSDGRHLTYPNFPSEFKGCKSPDKVRTINSQMLPTFQAACEALGIASLLLPAGRTAHSRFKLPLELTDESFCHAKKKSQLGKLLVETYLIIWDEAPMNDKRCFETLDRTLRDPMDAPNVLFGGKTIVLGEQNIYLSNDEAIPMGSETELLYPTEYLNTITFLGFPPYELELKVGSPIMLLRNVILLGALCNGTRMIVRCLMPPRNMSQHTIAALRIGQDNCILEARVYRKWTSKNITDMKELAFCCILIDRENNAIQANMDINNIRYFNTLLKLNAVYRFLHFICEKTKPYHQTLENPISLKFGKITTFEVLTGKESEFLKHHFEFIAYNQLASRVPYQDEKSKTIYPILIGNE